MKNKKLCLISVSASIVMRPCCGDLSFRIYSFETAYTARHRQNAEPKSFVLILTVAKIIKRMKPRKFFDA